MSELNTVGSEYKNFVVVSKDKLPDYKAEGIYLRHKTTGLEIYHIIKDDRENMFSFAFRTLAKNSKGAAHITEHSVLCGSEKFPLKEPFSTLANQSLNTFLNALTYPEKTMYPASSLVKSDYYNLMDVYADAVFFPKLEKQTFLQEGHRLEMDENGKLSIQGVVYNEMKANYSSFNGVAINSLISTMYPDSYMSYDSGGDPSDIPSLSYEEFVAFHKKFYSPSNCLLVLYGNIPTTEQLDFLAEKYIPRLEKFYGTFEANVKSKTPLISKEIKELGKLNIPSESKTVKTIAPANGATGIMCGLAWSAGRGGYEQYYLSEVLSGNDSSPLSWKLKESGLGDDEAPFNGNFGQILDENFIAYGLTGVKKGDEDKVYELVQKSIQEIYEEGIEEKDINAAVMDIDFNLREVTRNWGPYCLRIITKATAAWACGREPSEQLTPITSFEEFKEKLRKDKDFTKKLIKKYFIDNKVCIKYSAEPTETFFEERNKKETEKISELEKTINKSELKKELDKLHEYQQKQETEQELSCIPHLKVKDLDTTLEEIKVEYKELKASDGGAAPVVYSKEPTNGITYIDVGFPIDNLEPKDILPLAVMADMLTEIGWKGKKWDQAISEMAEIMGDLGTRVLLNSNDPCPEVTANAKTYKNKNITDRKWLVFSGKFLTEKSKESLEYISELIKNLDFGDKKRIETLLGEYKLNRKTEFIDNGAMHVFNRSRAGNSKRETLNELFWGISQFMYSTSLKKEDVPALQKDFLRIYKSIIDQGAILHITADEKSIQAVNELLPDFIKSTGLKTLAPSKNIPLSEYNKQIYRPEDYDENQKREIIKIATQAGFANMSTACSGSLIIESAAEDIVCNWLNGHQLWEKVRMTGGAYGSSSSNDSSARIFYITSWRDPTPLKTLDVYIEALKEVSEKDFTAEEVERTILSIYSNYITPDSPIGRGNRGINRFLYANTQELIQKSLELILKVTPKDVKEAAKRMYENAKKSRKEVVICDNSVNCSGNILKIPL